jgi:hypothetical protein
MRRIGIRRTISSGVPSVKAVSVSPGSTELTAMPMRANSTAATRPNWVSAAFDAA